jgi:hypothetical protein
VGTESHRKARKTRFTKFWVVNALEETWGKFPLLLVAGDVLFLNLGPFVFITFFSFLGGGCVIFIVICSVRLHSALLSVRFIFHKEKNFQRGKLVRVCGAQEDFG